MYNLVCKLLQTFHIYKHLQTLHLQTHFTGFTSGPSTADCIVTQNSEYHYLSGKMQMCGSVDDTLTLTNVVRYPRYLDIYHRYRRDDTSIAKVVIYK